MPIAITLGDAAGIGPEIIVKAFSRCARAHAWLFCGGRCGHAAPGGAVLWRGPVWLCRWLSWLMCRRRWAARRVVCRCGRSARRLWTVRRQSRLARSVPGRGRLAGDCVVWAAKAALRGEVAAMVTAPLNKEALSLAGAPYDAFPGHTELLQALAAAHVKTPVAQLPVRMMLANDELRTVLVSIHVSLRRRWRRSPLTRCCRRC